MIKLNKRIILKLFFFFLITNHQEALGDCNFKSGKYVTQLEKPNSVEKIIINVPKSKSYFKNLLTIDMNTKENTHINPEYKKKFNANIKVVYGFGTCNYKAKIWQNGDWKDHINASKFLRSLNVKLKDGNIMNSVKFKLLLPKTRNNYNEILGTLILRELGFIAPETFEVDVVVNGIKSRMLFQEDSTKELLERNLRREGPIFEGDETIMFYPNSGYISSDIDTDQVQLARLINNNWFNKGIISQHIVIKSFFDLQNSYLEYAINHNKTPNIVKPNMSNSKEFEDFYFMMIAMNGWHATRPHNRKYYYNSFQSKFEPIYYDGMLHLTHQINLDLENQKKSYKTGYFGYRNAFNNNYKFSYMDKISQPRFNYKIISKFKDRVISYDSSLDAFYKNSISTIRKNILYLQNNINNIEPSILPKEKKENIRKIFLANLNEVGFIQEYIENIDLIENNYEITTNRRNFKVDHTELSNIFKTNKYKSKRLVFLLNKLPEFITNNLKFDVFKIPILNTKVIKSPGIKIDIIKDKKILNISQSNSKDWILFSSGEANDWTFNFHGLGINTPNQNNSQRYNFHGLTGCLNFYDYKFNNVSFNIQGGGCEDSLNIVSSKGNIEKIKISDSFSDGLDIDFSDLNLNYVEIIKAGNDCIDLSGGNYYIDKINVSNCFDKGVSIGEKSKLTLLDAKVESSNIGFSVKDLSILLAEKVDSSAFKTCLELFQKKQEFGGGKVVIDLLKCPSGIIKDRNSFVVYENQ